MKEKIIKIIIIITTTIIILGFGLIEKVSASEYNYFYYNNWKINSVNGTRCQQTSTIPYLYNQNYCGWNDTNLSTTINYFGSYNNDIVIPTNAKYLILSMYLNYGNYGEIDGSADLIESPYRTYYDYDLNIWINNSSISLMANWGGQSSICTGNAVGNFITWTCPVLKNTTNLTFFALNTIGKPYAFGLSGNLLWEIEENGTSTIQGAINNQTQSIIGETHTYNNTPSETIDRTQMDEYQEAEDELLNNIDLSGAEDIEVSINANASNFIWGIVNRLRGISGKIVLLFTSILSLGIIKMVMNR